MRATLMYGAGDVRVQTVPDPVLHQSTDAIVRVLASAICGSDLWPYGSLPPSSLGRRMGHEFLGVVEDVGADVSTLKRGEVVVAPFVWSDGTCEFCREGLPTSCRHGGQWGHTLDGGQGEAVRVPQADGTLVTLPVGEDSALLPALLTLSDVFCTGHHCAVSAGVSERTTVTVIGDGAVGLTAVLAAKRLGAEQIVLMGRHRDRTDLGRRFGATEIVTERGQEGAQKVRELSGGDGTHTVLECVGTRSALETAFAMTRPGGTVSRVGAPQYEEFTMGFGHFMNNIRLVGGVAPARAYIPELLPDVLAGRIEPGLMFDRSVGLDQIPDGYRAMAERHALKVMIRP